MITCLTKKRPSLLLTFSIIVLFCLSGCGKDSSPTQPETSTHTLKVTFDSATTVLELDDLDTIKIDNLDTIMLTALVDTSVVTEPRNYAYRFVGADGFYAHQKGDPDNTWEQLQGGYLTLSTMKVSFDPSLELLSRYNIKDVQELKIVRKIDLVAPDGAVTQFVIDEMTTAAFEDSLNGIRLTEFVPAAVIADPAAWSYEVTAPDDYSWTIGYEELQTGYYVLEYDRVLYTNPDISGKAKVKYLNRIVAVAPAE